MFAVEQQDQRSTDPQPQLLLLCADLWKCNAWDGVAWHGDWTGPTRSKDLWSDQKRAWNRVSSYYLSQVTYLTTTGHVRRRCSSLFASIANSPFGARFDTFLSSGRGAGVFEKCIPPIALSGTILFSTSTINVFSSSRVRLFGDILIATNRHRKRRNKRNMAGCGPVHFTQPAVHF